MLVLALDTTTRAGSAAIVDDDRVVEERSGDPSRTHAERLPGEIVALLEAHDLALAHVDLFAVASGPGSFTGLRIGIATMQGLAFVGRRRIVAVPALDALGHLASQDVTPDAYVAAWMDAHRRDVFAALYRVASFPGAPAFDPERLIEIEGPSVGDPTSTIARWRRRIADAPVTVMGDAVPVFADFLARHAPMWRGVPPPPLAGAIGRLALARARRGETVDPAAVHPLYIRRPDAELARENAPLQGSQGIRPSTGSG